VVFTPLACLFEGQTVNNRWGEKRYLSSLEEVANCQARVIGIATRMGLVVRTIDSAS
jgi:hypothetical protein